MSSQVSAKDNCPVCHRALNVPYGAVVELLEDGKEIQKVMFYGLHQQCAKDWSLSEMKRLQAGHPNDTCFSFVEIEH